MNTYKLNKREAKKIVTHLKSEYEKRSAKELLDLLNNKELHEIYLQSGAKVCGQDREYFLRTYAWDNRDGRDALGLVGRCV